MKLSPAAVRRSRIERGWSQEQLAIASGLSPRTVQRVESEGVASLSTAASLAATFAFPLAQLQEEPARAGKDPDISVQGAFFIGLALLMLAVFGEAGRLPGNPQSAALAAVNILAAVAGATLVIPAGTRILSARQYAGAALAVLGTPLVTLLIGGLIVSALTGRPPLWQLTGFGAGGIALVVMADREFRRGRRTDGA